MSLVTEDGTGVTGAESYVSVDDALLYHANRGNSAWASLTATLQEQALRRATDYLQQSYRGRWKGYRSNLAQGLDFPRKAIILSDMAINYMIPYNVIPDEVKKACAELALRAAAGELAADLTQGIISESVGALSTTYDSRTPQYTRYRAIDMLLKHLVVGSNAMVRLGRG